jgi:hypothetical protein
MLSTGIRQRKRHITPAGHGRVFVAFPADVVVFLNHLANGEHAAAATQNQALSFDHGWTPGPL